MTTTTYLERVHNLDIARTYERSTLVTEAGGVLHAQPGNGKVYHGNDAGWCAAHELPELTAHLLRGAAYGHTEYRLEPIALANATRDPVTVDTWTRNGADRSEAVCSACGGRSLATDQPGSIAAWVEHHRRNHHGLPTNHEEQ